MKISKNFDIEEFVPKDKFLKFGQSCTWFINPKIVQLAEFYKEFFIDYYTKKYTNKKVSNVLIVINNWHKGGSYQYRGWRPKNYLEGGEDSQHRLANGFDCDINIVFEDGSQMEADYKEIHKAILSNEALFISKGLSAIEDVSIAATWLHSDCRWIPNQNKILVVKPS